MCHDFLFSFFFIIDEWHFSFFLQSKIQRSIYFLISTGCLQQAATCKFFVTRVALATNTGVEFSVDNGYQYLTHLHSGLSPSIPITMLIAFSLSFHSDVLIYLVLFYPLLFFSWFLLLSILGFYWHSISRIMCLDPGTKSPPLKYTSCAIFYYLFLKDIASLFWVYSIPNRWRLCWRTWKLHDTKFSVPWMSSTTGPGWPIPWPNT